MFATTQTAYRMAMDIQRRLFFTSQKKGISATELASVARAWSIIEDQKRVMRGKAKPRAANVDELKKMSRRPVHGDGPIEASPDEIQELMAKLNGRPAELSTEDQNGASTEPKVETPIGQVNVNADPKTDAQRKGISFGSGGYWQGRRGGE
jgi:hypothetical protein